MKIGNDIIEVARIEKACQDDKFIKKVYTKNETDYAEGKFQKYQHLAGMFAVKESVIKALEQGAYSEIEIIHKKNGAPYVALSGRTKELFLKKYNQIEISISHTSQYASAVAIIF